MIYIKGLEGNFINICINSLVGTNYLMIDSSSIIKDDFISKAAEKGCSCILFKYLSKFDEIKKDTIAKYLQTNTYKKIKIIYIDDDFEKILINKDVPKELTLDFSI